MTTATTGVLRRARADVPETLMHPVSVFRPVRDHGQFVVDATIDGYREVDEMRTSKRRRRRGAR